MVLKPGLGLLELLESEVSLELLELLEPLSLSLSDSPESAGGGANFDGSGGPSWRALSRDFGRVRGELSMSGDGVGSLFNAIASLALALALVFRHSSCSSDDAEDASP